MVMSFYAVTPEELEEVLLGNEDVLDEVLEDRPGFAQTDLDKAWDGLQFLFSAADIDIDLLKDGDPIRDDGSRFGWSAATVAQAANTLRDMPFSDLARHYDANRMSDSDIYPTIWTTDWALDYLQENYGDLRTFLTDTAAKEQAALMFWG